MAKKNPLRQQFTRFFTLLFLGGIILSGLILSFTVQHRLDLEVAGHAKMLTQTINAAKLYTGEHIKPQLAVQSDIEPDFIHAAVPGYSAEEIFENFRKSPGYASLSYKYKEAALNLPNLGNQANNLKTQLVESLCQDQAAAELTDCLNRPVVKWREIGYINRSRTSVSRCWISSASRTMSDCYER